MLQRLGLAKEAMTVILREDYRKIASIYGDGREADRIIAHYTLERRLADEMRNSTKADREGGLYNRMYDELLGGLKDHPRKRAETEEARASKQRYVERQARMILGEARPDDVFLEVGGGDCRVALLVAPHVAKSIVVDVSSALVPLAIEATNFAFVQTSGVDIPLPSESVSFIYSNQVMEHLHPEDALEQLRELFRVLKPGGRYLCRTPHRVTGPHDVSRYFDDVARGTHMREYSYAELHQIFRSAGFSRMRILIAPRAHRAFALPQAIAEMLEKLCARVPRKYHTTICRSRLVRALLGMTVIAEKPRG